MNKRRHITQNIRVGTRYCKFTHHQISSVSLYLYLLLLYASLEKHVIINQVGCLDAFYHCLTLLMKCNRNEIIENIMKYLVLCLNLCTFIFHLVVCACVYKSLCLICQQIFIFDLWYFTLYLMLFLLYIVYATVIIWVPWKCFSQKCFEFFWISSFNEVDLVPFINTMYSVVNWMPVNEYLRQLLPR